MRSVHTPGFSHLDLGEITAVVNAEDDMSKVAGGLVAKVLILQLIRR